MPLLCSEATSEVNIVKLTFKHEVKSFWPPYMLTSPDLVDSVRQHLLEMQRGSGAALAVTLTPKSGKTSILFRILPPLIYELWADACVITINCCDLPTDGEGQMPRQADFLLALCSSMETELKQHGVDLGVLPPDPENRLRAIFSAAEHDTRTIFFVIDEFQRVAMFTDPARVADTINIFKAAMCRQGVYLALSGSGMVMALSGIRLSNTNGRRFIDTLALVSLDTPLHEQHARFVAEDLIKCFRETFEVPESCPLDGDTLLDEVKQLGELRTSTMAWFLLELQRHRWSMSGTRTSLEVKLTNEFKLDSKPLLTSVPQRLLKHLRAMATGETLDPPHHGTSSDDLYFDYVNILAPILHSDVPGQYRLLAPYDVMFAQMIDKDGNVDEGYSFNKSTFLLHPLLLLSQAHAHLGKTQHGATRSTILNKIQDELERTFDCDLSGCTNLSNFRALGGGLGGHILDHPYCTEVKKDVEVAGHVNMNQALAALRHALVGHYLGEVYDNPAITKAAKDHHKLWTSLGSMIFKELRDNAQRK